MHFFFNVKVNFSIGFQGQTDTKLICSIGSLVRTDTKFFHVYFKIQAFSKVCCLLNPKQAIAYKVHRYSQNRNPFKT